jgi:uncharacterized membrane protein
VPRGTDWSLFQATRCHASFSPWLVALGADGPGCGVAMPNNEPYDVISASFASEAGADLALSALQRAEQAELLDIESAAVIVKDANGEVTLSETEDQSGRQGLGRGLITGGLMGLLLPGKSFVSSALKQGVSGGFLARLRDTGFEDDDLRAMAEDLAPGTSMLVAIVQYQYSGDLSSFLQEHGAAIVKTRLSPEGAAVLEEMGQAIQTARGTAR